MGARPSLESRESPQSLPIFASSFHNNSRLRSRALEQKGLPRMNHLSDRLLRRREVEAVTGMSRSTLYAKVAERTFPEPVQLRGSHAVRWRASQVRKWMDSLTQRTASECTQAVALSRGSRRGARPRARQRANKKPGDLSRDRPGGS